MNDTKQQNTDDTLIQEVTIEEYAEVPDSDIGSAGGQSSLTEYEEFEEDFDTNLEDLTDLDEERI